MYNARKTRIALSEARTVDRLQMCCKHKLVKLSAVCTNEGRLFQTAETQHENRPAAMFVDEDCVDSRSDVDDLRTSDCLYDESRPLQITNRSFTYASPHLWNQLPSSFRQPHCVHSPPGSPHPTHITSSQSSPSFSPSVTPSTFYSRLKTHLFHKSFPP